MLEDAVAPAIRLPTAKIETPRLHVEIPTSGAPTSISAGTA